MNNEQQQVDSELNVIKRIKSKYGDNKIHEGLKYHKAGIPEKYWFTNKIKYKYSDYIDSGRTEFFVLSDDTDEIMICISDLLKQFIRQNQNCINMNFFLMMNYMGNNYDQIQKLSDVVNTLTVYDVIAITGIKYGQIFNTKLESFLILRENLLNDNIDKKLIYGFEGVNESTTAKLEEAYGEFYDIIKPNSLIKL